MLNWFILIFCMPKRIFSIFTALILVTILFIPVHAVNTGSIAVSSASGKAGDTVEIKLDLSANPGVVALRLFVSYDSSRLKLLSVTDGKLLGTATGIFGNDISAVPYTLMWEDGLSAVNHTSNGTLAEIKFKITDNAPTGSTSVMVSYDQASTFDKDLKDIPVQITNGNVAVTGTDGIVSESCKHTNTAQQTLKDSDCTLSGITVKKCADCGTVLENVSIPVKGHSFNTWQTRVVSPQSNTGLEFRRCGKCNFEETRAAAKPGEAASSGVNGNNSSEGALSSQAETNESNGTISKAKTNESISAAESEASKANEKTQPQNKDADKTAIIICLSLAAAAVLGVIAAVLLIKHKNKDGAR